MNGGIRPRSLPASLGAVAWRFLSRGRKSASQILAERHEAVEAALHARIAELSRELEASRAQHRSIAENLSDVIVLRRRASHDWQSVTPSGAALFGLDPEALQCFRIADNIHPDDEPAIRAEEAALEAGQPAVTCLFRLRRQDGRWVWIESLSSRIASAAPDEPDVVAVLRDVSARQNQLDELRIARDLAELAQAKAENANRAKSEFLAVMSHEIRTPLSTIKGFTELLAESKPLGGDQTRYIALVADATSTMLTAVDDILDLAKVESGDMQLDRRPFALAPAIESVVAIASSVAARHGTILGHTLADGLPVHVLGDERRLRQIVLNLLNAILRCRRGGVVTLSVQRQDGDGDRYDIMVGANGGRVIASEIGGLGLTIARRLLGLIGGQLESSGSEGDSPSYRFSLRLPAANAFEPGRPAAAPQPPRSRPARLLVAEDHVVNQEIVRKMLERAGHVVDIVCDGAQALSAVQARSYDLVLMDVQMPGMDGLTATRRIRALQHPCRRVPVVAMTANVLPEQVRAFQEAGMNGHVAKPFDRENLRAAIDAQLSSVLLVDGDGGDADPILPVIFDRKAYDGLCESLGAEGARGALRGFVALLGATQADASTVAVAARRLGFLDLAMAHERLAAAPGNEESLTRCRIARELAHRVLDELNEGARGEAASRIALL